MEPQQTPTDREQAPQPEAVQPVAQPKEIHLHKNSGSIEAITEPGEVLIFRVKKHPFGIIIFYIQAILGFGLASGLLYFLVPDLASGTQIDSVKSWLKLGITLFGGLLAIIMIIVTWIYRQNELILTDRNVVQVIKNGLFDRQVSQLTLNNIEDVTADKRGIWAMIFNFGQIRIETAGEQNNFHYSYCPNPNHYGQLLVDARAKCIGRHGGGNTP